MFCLCLAHSITNYVYSTRVFWCLCYEPCLAVCVACPTLAPQLPSLVRRCCARLVDHIDLFGCLSGSSDDSDDDSDDDSQSIVSHGVDLEAQQGVSGLSQWLPSPVAHVAKKGVYRPLGSNSSHEVGTRDRRLKTTKGSVELQSSVSRKKPMNTSKGRNSRNNRIDNRGQQQSHQNRNYLHHDSDSFSDSDSNSDSTGDDSGDSDSDISDSSSGSDQSSGSYSSDSDDSDL